MYTYSIRIVGGLYNLSSFFFPYTRILWRPVHPNSTTRVQRHSSYRCSLDRPRAPAAGAAQPVHGPHQLGASPPSISLLAARRFPRELRDSPTQLREPASSLPLEFPIAQSRQQSSRKAKTTDQQVKIYAIGQLVDGMRHDETRSAY